MRKKLTAISLLEVRITKSEHKLLSSILILDPESEAILKKSTKSSDGSFILKANLDDFDNFLGYLSAEANHEESSKRQELLDAVHEKISEQLGI
jgi:hypothetical protein